MMTAPVEPIRTVPAWQLIGWDNGKIRIHGGRTMYESCDGSAMAENVLLQRLDTTGSWPRAVRRYVPADTLIDVMEVVEVT